MKRHSPGALSGREELVGSRSEWIAEAKVGDIKAKRGMVLLLFLSVLVLLFVFLLFFFPLLLVAFSLFLSLLLLLLLPLLLLLIPLLKVLTQTSETHKCVGHVRALRKVSPLHKEQGLTKESSAEATEKQFEIRVSATSNTAPCHAFLHNDRVQSCLVRPSFQRQP